MHCGAAFFLAVLSFDASSHAESNPQVTLCEVLKDPSGFEQKEFVIIAGYRVGYEWQELLCFNCLGNEKVWVEFDPEVRSISKLQRSKAFDQLYKVTLRGTFAGGGHRYGHENGYAFQFHVIEVKSAKLLWKLTHSHKEMRSDVKTKVCTQ